MLKAFFTFSLILTVSIVNAVMRTPPQLITQPPNNEILYQVSDSQYDGHKPFILECEAEGEPAPYYRWTKNGEPFRWDEDRSLQQPGRGTLVFTVPWNEDEGLYQCFASNMWGTAMSNSVLVRKTHLASFNSSELPPVEANEGIPLKLECEPPLGYPKPNISWATGYKGGGAGIKAINDSRLTVDPEGNLWFSNVTEYDNSSYYCVAASSIREEYKIGSKRRLSLKKSVMPPSEIRFPPLRQYVTHKNEVVLLGQRAELFCIYSGTPLPTIDWSKDSTLIQQNDRVTLGNHGKSLIITDVKFEDEGEYLCSASNGVGGNASHTIKLGVLAAPYFLVEPEAVDVPPGDSVELTCEATGRPAPATHWIYNGKPIEQAPPNARRTVTKNRITLSEVVRDDTGNYGCKVSNPLGYVYKDVYVNVLATPPEFIDRFSKEEYKAAEGVAATLNCRAAGSPKPTVTWIRGDGSQLTGGRYRIDKTGDLIINSVQPSDSGEYTCQAVNKFGERTLKARFIVKKPATIIQASQGIHVTVNNSITFRCEAQVDPSLSSAVSWLHNGVEIDFDAEKRFVMNDFSLSIEKADSLDSGNYTCLVSTTLNETVYSVTLIVHDVPNAPRLATMECNVRDAMISWEPTGDGNSVISHYVIEYNTSTLPHTWAVKADHIKGVSEFTVSLDPGVTHIFRVIAVNTIGSSKPSLPSIPCTIQDQVPHKNPSYVDGTGPEPSKLRISWDPMSQNQHNAPGFHYIVQWKRIAMRAEWNEQKVHDWRKNSIEISDQPYHRYWIRVFAANDLGTSSMQPTVVSGYSGEDVPLEAPTGLTLERFFGDTAAYLSWRPVPPEKVRGELKGYKLQCWNDVDTKEKLQTTIVAGIGYSGIIFGLRANAKNYVQVLVYNGKYDGPSSDVLEIKTPQKTPGGVPSLDAIPLGTSAFLLQWREPGEPNGNVTGYTISYKERSAGDDEASLPGPQINDPSIRSVRLDGLKPNTEYGVKIVPSNEAGDGDYHITYKKTGADGLIPGTPTFKWEIIPYQNGLIRVKVFWQPNYSRPGSYFFVNYRVKGDVLWHRSEDVTTEVYAIVTVPEDKIFEYQVVSVNDFRGKRHLAESSIKEIPESDGKTSAYPGKWGMLVELFQKLMVVAT